MALAFEPAVLVGILHSLIYEDPTLDLVMGLGRWLPAVAEWVLSEERSPALLPLPPVTTFR